jgi:hypothetical protein
VNTGILYTGLLIFSFIETVWYGLPTPTPTQWHSDKELMHLLVREANAAPLLTEGYFTKIVILICKYNSLILTACQRKSRRSRRPSGESAPLPSARNPTPIARHRTRLGPSTIPRQKSPLPACQGPGARRDGVGSGPERSPEKPV